ncbi:MAG: ArsR family transcriptional regulator, arsenate/arsenite/antimonite-responsive transcriptional [Bacteroidales bacterium]|jgi:DNA-binding transcriptional ArsR family regulator|nr:ArsR family transcriptional regulator, arsenate/arsenite/antimonite-responsive transcriptional [Bacteroidales bacterium]MDN5329813.1 ArsR family transcriptional regulator, arsenate/arsenite/antimonite-responsive transcriptional [Bacteroidales bacterium]
MKKEEQFTEELQELAHFARAISHPARLAILQYLAQTHTCISGDISDSIPLSRTTVSQHLKELKEIGLIHGETEGVRIHYCLCAENLHRLLNLFNSFFEPVKNASVECKIRKPFKTKNDENNK